MSTRWWPGPLTGWSSSSQGRRNQVGAGGLVGCGDEAEVHVGRCLLVCLLLFYPLPLSHPSFPPPSLLLSLSFPPSTFLSDLLLVPPFLSPTSSSFLSLNDTDSHYVTIFLYGMRHFAKPMDVATKLIRRYPPQTL